jgi:uncharacterized membrane protein YfcA
VLLFLTLLAGVAAGGLGALLGLGGGVIVVPLLHLYLGVSFEEARAASLVGVLATSSAVAASSAGRRLLNPRLAIVLLVFSVGGATLGARVLGLLPPEVYPRIFGVTSAAIAVVMLARLNKRNVLDDPALETGVLGGRFRDSDTGREVSYRLRRLPLAAGGSVLAGVLATFVGVGGGILIVPVLNSWCGVPVRVAAATSAFMIGITAVPGTLAFWSRGYLGDFQLAAAASLGVLAGYRLGLRVTERAKVQWLKVLMAALLAFVAWEYLR